MPFCASSKIRVFLDLYNKYIVNIHLIKYILIYIYIDLINSYQGFGLCSHIWRAVANGQKLDLGPACVHKSQRLDLALGPAAGLTGEVTCATPAPWFVYLQNSKKAIGRTGY